MIQKIAFIFGTRPEIIKLYPLINYCVKHNVDFILIHSNQHYDKEVDQVFFEELELPQPKYNLGAGSGSHGKMTAKIIELTESILLDEKPTVVIVQGDTNTVLAGAIAASKIPGIKIAHVEAGLRSYDREMPEEINRIMADHASDYLFSPTKIQVDILKSEGVNPAKIYMTGNTVVDSVELSKSKVSRNKELYNKKFSIRDNQNFTLLTCHRPSNTDNPEAFRSIMEGVNEINVKNDWISIFPAHPRLKNREEIYNYSNIRVVAPTSYLEMIYLQTNSEMIFTDSGGIQEESCILEKKAIILRLNTERPEAIEVGGAILLDEMTKDQIISKFNILKNRKVDWYNPFGDGSTTTQIMKVLIK